VAKQPEQAKADAQAKKNADRPGEKETVERP